jgi:hypothetical protein
MENYLWIDYNKTSTGGEPDNPNNIYSSHSDLVHEIRVNGIKLSDESLFSYREHIQVDFVPKVGDNVYLVSVTYNTGSTFGRELGCVQFVAIFDSEDNANRLKKIIDHTDKGDRSFISGLPNRFYPNWLGYFDEFVSCDISCHTVCA